MADKYKAAIDDVFEFDCETIEDSFEKAIARHEIPYRPGALLEDMGQKARVIKIRCYFLNEWYETHKSLINYLDLPGHTYELSHPKYGIIKGQIETMVVRHDDREQTAEIDLTYVEHLRGIIDTVFNPPVRAWIVEKFDEGQLELQEKLTKDIWDQYLEDFNELLKEIDPTETELFKQFSGLSQKAQDFVKGVDRYVGRLKSTLNQIQSPANSLVSTITYDTNLPGVVIGSLAGAVERYALLYNTTKDAPDRFLQSYRNGVAELEDAFDDFSEYTGIAKTQREAVEIGAILEEDQARDSAYRQSAKVKSFSPLGRPQKSIEEMERLLTITEIDNALAIVRADLQTAINYAREMQSLKSMAAALTEHVIQIKKSRPPLKAVEIDNAMPLHLICLKYGLSYNDAEQIMAINRIRHPNFVTGEIQIYGG